MSVLGGTLVSELRGEPRRGAGALRSFLHCWTTDETDEGKKGRQMTKPVHKTRDELQQEGIERCRRAARARNPGFVRSSLVGAVDRQVSDDRRAAARKREQDERIDGLKRGVAALRTQVEKAAGRSIFKGVLRLRPNR